MCKAVWNPSIGEDFVVLHQIVNEYDRHAMAVYEIDWTICYYMRILLLLSVITMAQTCCQANVAQVPKFLLKKYFTLVIRMPNN